MAAPLTLLYGISIYIAKVFNPATKRMRKNNLLDPLKTSSYDYDLPKELIATKTCKPSR